jgi:hypothetical protein
VNPQRVRVILEFSVKMAQDPKSITQEDFDRMRDFVVSDEDILEIVLLAAHAVSADIIADTLRVPVETAVYDALGR